ncbi:hypothetical protein LJ739_05540 [Aestuariibacter halophilus]|uniref:Uncharacterized protein n=1 Tax=Fluctibacter halophilus TaxID=226011 RepID=A0ABS8G5D3_9ALTE|nr:hypothetical protein [Aestuariibacter halophilus]MCC2615698.1 hypothetical protein [Aestuariibacter halophilus]
MFESKLKVEKIELVKRIIRQNNYRQFEKTHNQCLELGLVVNRSALDRFASKLELIDKAELSKRQYELHKLELAKRQQKQTAAARKPVATKASPPAPTTTTVTTNVPQQVVRAPISKRKHVELQSMTYDQVKQREAEITFALGELKIRENELLQELINLTELLDSKQFN